MYAFRSMRQNTFRDRKDAGQQLAHKLKEAFGLTHETRSQHNFLVLGLPRGALPVCAPVCDALRCPLDILVTKKIGAPGHEEFAIGAVSPRGRVELNEHARQYADYARRKAPEVMKQAQQKEAQYRDQNRPFHEIRDKDIILVDDGIATGMTMKAAVDDVKDAGAKSITVAVPVLPPDTRSDFEENPNVDKLIYVMCPREFYAVGQFYDDFGQTEDDEAVAILREYANKYPSGSTA